MVQCPKCLKTRLMRVTNFHRGKDTGICITCFNSRRGGNGNGFKHEGYIFVKAQGHHRATKEGYVKRAILVMEDKLGRLLNPTEHTHHLNDKRDDDRPENLINLTNSEHAKLHMTKKPNIKNRYTMALTQPVS